MKSKNNIEMRRIRDYSQRVGGSIMPRGGFASFKCDSSFADFPGGMSRPSSNKLSRRNG